MQQQVCQELEQEQQVISAQSKSAYLPLSHLEGKNGEDQREAQRHDLFVAKSSTTKTGKESILAPKDLFSGHNPIRWIAECCIPVKTVAMLLKWYPIGAFQRRWDEDAALADEQVEYNLQDMEIESPLIEIVDDFARDHYNVSAGGTDYDDVQLSEQEQMSANTRQQQEDRRKENRWENFVQILHANDLVLQTTRVPMPSPEEENPTMPASKILPKASSAATTAAAPSKNKYSTPAKSEHESPTATSSSRLTAPFHPVHAWIRCLTSPHLGLE